MFGFFDSWDLSIGIVSLVLLVPTIVHLVMKQLPSRRLRTLLALLEDTEVLFNASVEEGLLKDPDNRTFQRQLTILRGHAEAVRAEIYAAKSCGDDFSNLLRGVTRRVNNLCFRVKKLRVNISHAGERKEAEGRGRAPLVLAR
ncbi:hypothetical protein PYCCODRAFT_1428382 [Trametes coccinea BRFM310]|uniref:Uncharacterized protein n=1 Tax=Trametes coccinea (strain BRFM310) TaxID=1353009 RepID=A0A1Y2I8W2_TRAC3|nr:hypothetical protein PYCCODRAFT_1428382 [Trametes coccinea BRFM310]